MNKNYKLIFLLGFGVIALALGVIFVGLRSISHVETSKIKVTIRDSWDWQLPGYVQPSKYSGFYDDASPANRSKYTKTDHLKICWKQLQPRQPAGASNNWGFDPTITSELFNRLNDPLAPKNGFNIYVYATEVNKDPGTAKIIDCVPDWALQDNRPGKPHAVIAPVELTQPGCNYQTDRDLEYDCTRRHAPIWDPAFNYNYSTLFVRNLKHLQDNGLQLLHHPRIRFVYMQMISHSRGEEFFVSQELVEKVFLNNTLDNPADDIPLAQLESVLKDRIDAWVEIMGDNRYKLAWMSWGKFIQGYADTYGNLGHSLAEYAFSKGTGQRSGIAENYHVCLGNCPLLGQTLEDIDEYQEPEQPVYLKGYLKLDETVPVLSQAPQPRIFADENEEHYIGLNEQSLSFLGWDPAYRFIVSNLRALQMRRNWLWIYKSTDEFDQISETRGLNNYVLLNLGKQVDTAPDAWSLLREDYNIYDPYRKKRLIVQNMERWLYQRDSRWLEGASQGETQPIYIYYKTDHNISQALRQREQSQFRLSISEIKAVLGDKEPAIWEYQARRTDVATGNIRMYFKADPQFLREVTSDLTLKVTYHDNRARWRLWYFDASGNLTRTPLINNQDSGKIKTATFSPLTLNTSQAAYTFYIEVEGPDDFIGRMVRLIKEKPN